MRTRRGGVMVLTLAVLTGLVAALAAAASSQRLAFRAGLTRMDERRADIAARAGVEYALAALQTQDRAATTLQDDWATLGNHGNERFYIGDVSFRIEILDAAALINLNTARREQLERLGLTEAQIDSLLDWREPGSTPRPQGAKDEYYNSLQRPYNAKLRNFDSLDELLLVRDFTPETLYEPLTVLEPMQTEAPAFADLATVSSLSQDSSPEGGAKLNINSAQAGVAQLIQRARISPALAAQIVQRRANQGPFTSLGQVLALPGVGAMDAANILDYLSITGQQTVSGRINLNTVSEAVLQTVPDLAPDAVQAILSRQSAGFARLGELATLPGVSMQSLRTVADMFTINSQVFLVRVMGEAAGIERGYLATVTISPSARLIKFEEVAPVDQARWGWSEAPEAESTLVEAA